MTTNQTEPSIRAAIAAMREAGASNDELIDEAVRQIFMQLGEYPSQARVLDLVRSPGRSPSAGTVQKGITRFFAGIRSRMGASLSHPDIPAEVLAEFSHGVASMWQVAMDGSIKALDERHKDLETEYQAKHQQMEIALAGAQANVQAARDDAERANQAAFADRAVAAEAVSAREQAVRELSVAMAEKAQLQEQVVNLRGQLSQAHSESEQQRQNHTSLLDSLRTEYESKLEDGRTALRQLDERTKSEINRLSGLLQANDDTIMQLRLANDREVQISERLRNELKLEQGASLDARRQSASKISELESKITEMTGSLGELTGRLDSADKDKVNLSAQLAESQRMVGAAEAHAKALQEELMAMQQKQGDSNEK